jgi:hypothetical protein
MNAKKKSLDINLHIAELLRLMAGILEQQDANPFRINAYHHGADTIANLDEPVDAILKRGGVDALIALPTIGKGIALAINEIINTGRWSQLDRLRGEIEPEKLFQTVPNIGPKLAHDIHEQLHIDTLEALESAAFEGRLEAVSGVGPRKASAIQASLAAILGKARPTRPAGDTGIKPIVADLLCVDAEYRKKAAAKKLPTISPKRFNPDNRAWLPVLHTTHGDWHYTAVFSNTARAHQLKKTGDWVVIYFYDHHHQEAQCTVVTETRGALIGKRVVRGREAECKEYYR